MKYLGSLLAVFFIFSASPSWSYDPNIVILHSYHFGQEWGDHELEGVLEVLHSKYPQIRPSVEYLDTNKFGSKEQIRKTSQYLIDKYASVRVDLVIPLDNPALNMIVDNQTKLFPGVPIVFCGVNNYDPKILKGRKKVTGLAEIAGASGSIELILKVNPETRRILVLNDHTITGKAIHRDMEPYIEKYRKSLSVEFLYPGTYENAQKQIDSLQSGTSVLIASFVVDSEGKALTIAEGTRMITSQNMVPVYTMRESRLGHGVVGGNMISGRDHGRRSARMALRVLDGEDPSSISVDTNDYSMPLFDYNVIEKLGIPLNRLPPGSFIINKRPTFFEAHKYPVLYSLGIIVILSLAVVLLSVNILKRKLAEKKLFDLSRYTTALFEEARDAIFVYDIETGIIADVNHAAEDLIKKPKSELVGLSHLELYLPENRKKAAYVFRQQSRKKIDAVELEIVTSQNDKIPVEITANSLDLPDGRRVVICAFRDVSDRNKLQEQLLHSQKLEAVGTLAGGVAHEFNNALTAIMGAAELLRMDMPPKSNLDDMLNVIMSSSESAARLTRNLLSFCRKQVYTPKAIDINSVLLQDEKLFKKLIGEDIQVVKMLCDLPCTVFADPGQIEQTIINLVLNARDAMPKGGKLEIRTEIVKGMDISANIAEPESLADYMLISIKDTGTGIDPAIRDKIFEPFFSTKEVGKGTGLGLSIVYGIIKQNNGFIDVKSEPGDGAEFRIFLPCCAKPFLDEQVEGEYIHCSEMGTILIAEDSETVRNMQSMILLNAGYKVFAVGNGKEAVDLFLEHADDIDIVVLDVVMPVMNGKEAYDEIIKIKPGVNIILVSGYADDIVTLKGIVQDSVAFLTKPFTLSQLLGKIKEVKEK